MFCCKCGARNAEHARFCHKCGDALYVEGTGQVGSAAENGTPPKVETFDSSEQQQLMSRLLPISQKPNECHACGRAEKLYTWDFGLGKIISTKRAWGQTALSVAVSAVTIPLLGAGGFELPGKKTRLRVLRLQLVLCDSCRHSHSRYDLHPWWEPARKLGYTEFLNADELKRLQPV